MLGLLLLIPCFQLGSGLYGDYPPMNQAGLQMLHDTYRDTGNTTGFRDALSDYRETSTYRLVCLSITPCSLPLSSSRLQLEVVSWSLVDRLHC